MTCASVSRAGASRITSLAWDEPGWLAEAIDWIDQHVERAGEVELVRTRPWSAIVRVPGADGVLWFKEDPPSLAFEPALTELLSTRHADCIPEVVAAEGRRLLTREAGPQLRTLLEARAPAPAWDEIVDTVRAARGSARDLRGRLRARLPLPFGERGQDPLPAAGGLASAPGVRPAHVHAGLAGDLRGSPRASR